MTFRGLDLTAPTLTLVEAAFDPRSERDRVPIKGAKPAGDAGGIPGGGGEPSIWEPIDEALRIGPPGQDGAASRSLKEVLGSLAIRLIDALGPMTEGDAPLAVVYPYGISPLLSRYLPVLLEREFLAIGDGANPPNLIGLEAPVALAIEAVARGACEPPAKLVLATGSGPTRELSVVSLELDGLDGSQRLTLAVRVRGAFAAGRPSESIAAVESVRRLIGSWSGWRLGAIGPVDDLAAALGTPPDRRLVLPGDPTHALAQAAIRFAGLLKRHGNLPTLGGMAEEVKVLGVCPAPVGVVGVNRDGRRYWSRLFEAGVELPTNPRALVESSQAGPGSGAEILLAECLDPAHRHARWLSQDDWDAARLRLHELARASKSRTRATSPTPQPGAHAWSFRLEHRKPGDAWGFLHWTIQYHPPQP